MEPRKYPTDFLGKSYRNFIHCSGYSGERERKRVCVMGVNPTRISSIVVGTVVRKSERERVCVCVCVCVMM